MLCGTWLNASVCCYSVLKIFFLFSRWVLERGLSSLAVQIMLTVQADTHLYILFIHTYTHASHASVIYRTRRIFQGNLIFMGSNQPQKLNPQIRNIKLYKNYHVSRGGWYTGISNYHIYGFIREQVSWYITNGNTGVPRAIKRLCSVFVEQLLDSWIVHWLKLRFTSFRFCSVIVLFRFGFILSSMNNLSTIELLTEKWHFTSFSFVPLPFCCCSISFFFQYAQAHNAPSVIINS